MVEWVQGVALQRGATHSLHTLQVVQVVGGSMSS